MLLFVIRVSAASFQGKRRHGRPRWTNVRPKRHKPNEEEEGEEEEKAGSASEEELCKSEEIPTEDACTHCGLPNHPELVLNRMVVVIYSGKHFIAATDDNIFIAEALKFCVSHNWTQNKALCCSCLLFQVLLCTNHVHLSYANDRTEEE